MKKFRKIFSLLMAAAMCAALSVSAFALDGCDSEVTAVTINGKSYKIWSTLLQDGAQYRGATWVQSADGSGILSGEVQIRSFLVDGQGQIINAALSAASNPGSTHVAYTPYFSAPGMEHYAAGIAYIKDGDGSYSFVSSPKAREGNPASLAAAVEAGQLTADGAYPRNSQGMTYGTLTLAGIVGPEPDLIAAVGPNNALDGLVSGYVRCDELFAPCETEGYAGKYIELYDLDGHSIGSFLITINNASRFAGKDMDEMRAELADGRSENPVLWALADKFLVDGKYPVNKNGETYGHRMLHELVGYMPQLVTAVNEDGVRGYVRNMDTPVVTRSGGKVWAFTPLYDQDGNVIGTFGGISIDQIDMAGMGVDIPEMKEIIGENRSISE